MRCSSRRSATARTSTTDRAEGVRRRQRPRPARAAPRARRSSTTRCSTARPRSRSPRTSASPSRRRRSSSTPTSPASRACARSSIARSSEARATGVVKTMFGRRRLVPELTSRNGQIRSAAEREAVNMPIQGTAADIMKRAMIDVHAALEGRTPPGRRARMILTVHDELLFEVPEGEADEIAELVAGSDGGADPLTVPLTVDVGIGENWKDAKPSSTLLSLHRVPTTTTAAPIAWTLLLSPGRCGLGRSSRPALLTAQRCREQSSMQGRATRSGGDCRRQRRAVRRNRIHHRQRWALRPQERAARFH